MPPKLCLGDIITDGYVISPIGSFYAKRKGSFIEVLNTSNERRCLGVFTRFLTLLTHSLSCKYLIGIRSGLIGSNIVLFEEITTKPISCCNEMCKLWTNMSGSLIELPQYIRHV